MPSVLSHEAWQNLLSNTFEVANLQRIVPDPDIEPHFNQHQESRIQVSHGYGARLSVGVVEMGRIDSSAVTTWTECGEDGRAVDYEASCQNVNAKRISVSHAEVRRYVMDHIDCRSNFEEFLTFYMKDDSSSERYQAVRRAYQNQSPLVRLGLQLFMTYCLTTHVLYLAENIDSNEGAAYPNRTAGSRYHGRNVAPPQVSLTIKTLLAAEWRRIHREFLDLVRLQKVGGRAFFDALCVLAITYEYLKYDGYFHQHEEADKVCEEAGKAVDALLKSGGLSTGKRMGGK